MAPQVRFGPRYAPSQSSKSPDSQVMKSFFVFRLMLAWSGVVFLAAIFWSTIPWLGQWELPVVVFCFGTMALVITGAISHIGRVQLIANHVDASTLANRQRRQVEIPFEAGEAFDLLDAAIRELPGV